mmetsp:Transcript_93770/g.270950  ORF Transcript_93770/g.270950 Transcript_93770/m.270950 type:complete len:261 (+) Transcript_93770:170-952(+)
MNLALPFSVAPPPSASAPLLAPRPLFSLRLIHKCCSGNCGGGIVAAPSPVGGSLHLAILGSFASVAFAPPAAGVFLAFALFLSRLVRCVPSAVSRVRLGGGAGVATGLSPVLRLLHLILRLSGLADPLPLLARRSSGRRSAGHFLPASPPPGIGSGRYHRFSSSSPTAIWRAILHPPRSRRRKLRRRLHQRWRLEGRWRCCGRHRRFPGLEGRDPRRNRGGTIEAGWSRIAPAAAVRRPHLARVVLSVAARARRRIRVRV